MKFLLPVALLATAAAAQTTSACAAANILSSCLGTTQGIANACSANDYGCLCDAYKSIVTCYNNCPSDPGASPAQNSRDTYCRYATTSTTSTATTAAGTTGSTSTQATTTGASGTTSTHSAASATGTNSGADLVMNAGGVLAAVAGVVVAML